MTAPTITVGTNSYASTTELAAYVDDRGLTLIEVPGVLLIKAMDWLEIQPFLGYKAVLTQALQFPRITTNTGYLDRWYSEIDIWADGLTVPDDIKKAQIVAAVLIDGGASLVGPVERAIKREKVDVLETEYMPGTSDATRYPELNLLLRPYVTGFGGSFQVIRG